MAQSNIVPFTQGRLPLASPFDEFNTPQSPIMFPVGERQLAWMQRTGDYAPLASHKAIIRLAPDGKSAHVLNVVPHTYKLVHNRELFTAIEDVMTNELGRQVIEGVKVNDQVADGGKTCIREYTFPNLKCSVRSDGRYGDGVKSDIAFRIVLRNAYGGASIRMFAGAIEYYCSNGMLIGAHDSTYYKHTRGLQIDRVAGNVIRSVREFTDAQDMWRKWCDTPVTREQTMALLRELVSTERLRDLLFHRCEDEAMDRGNNLWSIYSAMTAYASHSDGEFAPRRGMENVATTMLKRETDVRSWVQSDAWHRLLQSA